MVGFGTETIQVAKILAEKAPPLTSWDGLTTVPDEKVGNREPHSNLVLID